MFLRKLQLVKHYPLVICYIAMENPFKMEVLMGKSTINGQFSIAMLNNQMFFFWEWEHLIIMLFVAMIVLKKE